MNRPKEIRENFRKIDEIGDAVAERIFFGNEPQRINYGLQRFSHIVDGGKNTPDVFDGKNIPPRQSGQSPAVSGSSDDGEHDEHDQRAERAQKKNRSPVLFPFNRRFFISVFYADAVNDEQEGNDCRSSVTVPIRKNCHL